MNITDIRRQRLQQLIQERFGGTVLRCATALDMKPPQLHRWLSAGQGIREDSARKIEIKLGLPAGWLDISPESPQIQQTVASYNVIMSPEEKATYVIDGISALLHLAQLPDTCLGHRATIKDAVMAGKPPTTYGPEIIRAAVIEIWTESRNTIHDLDGSQVAQLIIDKLQGWIDAPSNAQPPTSPSQVLPDKKS